MNNIIECKLESTYKEIFIGLWQYDYGQILRITGVEFPKAVEIQFSLNEKSGSTITRIGTTVDGVTEVKIPDELLKNEGHSQDYSIYAYIYLTDETSGNTEYQIVLHVKSRTKPENPSEEPLPEPNIFHETVVAVNASAERAEKAEQKAKESAIEASKYASSASESATAAEKTKEDALKEVGEKKQEAIEAIQEQEETSVGKIVNHTDNEIQRIQNQTADSKAGLERTIKNADASKKELYESIQTAGDTKTALDKSTEMAGTAKTELDTSIQKAGTAKTALDKSAETAGTVQETLNATVKQAGALDTSLGEKIETGTQLKKDLTASGEKAVQDIQTAGSEQLGKIQAVAEEFTADREQITTNKEDIGSLKEDIYTQVEKTFSTNDDFDWQRNTYQLIGKKDNLFLLKNGNVLGVHSVDVEEASGYILTDATNVYTSGDILDDGNFKLVDNFHFLTQWKTGLTTGVEPIVITGIQTTENEKTYTYGSEGYILSIENSLIKDKSLLVNTVGAKLTGVSFMNFSGEHLSYPLADFMDLAYVIDRNGKVNKTILTDITFNFLGFTSLKCSAENAIRNSSKYVTSETKAVQKASAMADKKISKYDEAVQSLTALMTQGMYC